MSVKTDKWWNAREQIIYFYTIFARDAAEDQRSQVGNKKSFLSCSSTAALINDPAFRTGTVVR